jgi:3-oxoacyl-[acyl-carrier protein] reductase/bacilysin biosynthesis oxidoreductase BacG
MLDPNLSGKIAIITGGSAGIGFAISKALFEEGANIVIASNDQIETAAGLIRQLSPVAAKNEVLPVDIDLTKSDGARTVVKATLDYFHKVDILVNCAGAARAGSFLELSDQNFSDAWSLKLFGYIRMVREVLPHMIKSNDGRIVNIIGSSGRTPPATYLCGSTANAALINFTRGISKEISKHNIRINGISPGPTETEHWKRFVENTAKARGTSISEIMEETTSEMPIGRMIKPTEIANLALFLVSDLSAAITGAELLIDGGHTKGI